MSSNYIHYATGQSLHNLISYATDVVKTVVDPMSDGALCSYAGFTTSTFVRQDINNQCYIAMNACGDYYDLINFIGWHYCYFKNNYYFTIPVALFFIYLLFKFIGAVVEEFIAPGIAYLSEYLKMSDAFAAVTLLALANGAGDVITAIVASGAPGGVSYNIGALYGAGFFVTAIVIALTIKSSNEEIVLDKAIVYRDIGFYIVATLVTLVFAVMGNITYISAGVLLFIYCALVVVVMVQDQLEAKHKKQEEEEAEAAKAKKELEAQQQEKQKGASLLSKGGTMWKNAMSKMQANPEFQKEHQDRLAKRLAEAFIEKLNIQMEERAVPFHERGLADKIQEILEFPFEWIRNFTMPPCEHETYDKYKSYIWPLPSFLFCIWGITDAVTPQQFYISLGSAALITLILIITQRNSERNQVPGFFVIMVTYGVIVGLLWTYVASTVLIDLLSSIIIILKLNKTYMGMTILGVGNALPDGLTTIALAKQGYALMGISGSYAGQLFGLLVGFGLAMLKQTLVTGKSVVFDLFDPAKIQENLLDIWVIGCSLSCLVITFLYEVFNGFKLTKTLGNMLLGLYAIFFLGATGVQVYYLVNGIV